MPWDERKVDLGLNTAKHEMLYFDWIWFWLNILMADECSGVFVSFQEDEAMLDYD